MDKAKKLKVFYHPASALDNIIETFGERYFFIGKPKAVESSTHCPTSAHC